MCGCQYQHNRLSKGGDLVGVDSGFRRYDGKRVTKFFSELLGDDTSASVTPNGSHKNLGAGRQEKLCVDQPTLRFRYRTFQLLSSLNPLLNNRLNIGQGFSIGFSVSGATGQLRRLGNVGLIFLAPVNDDFVL